MKANAKKGIIIGIALILLFALWTVLVKKVDVQEWILNTEPEATKTEVGFSTVNIRFHELTGEHLDLYNLTDKIELLAIAVCAAFGVLGLIQLVQRKSLKKVDTDIILLGAYYIIVILAYLFFEKLKINYRPIPIENAVEASYPSSTTLLVLSVMPTLVFQVNRRVKNLNIKRIVIILTILYTAFVVIARLVSGVHWLTDIIGAVYLSAGLYLAYRGAVLTADAKKKESARV